jgi:hypothetical protein
MCQLKRCLAGDDWFFRAGLDVNKRKKISVDTKYRDPYALRRSLDVFGRLRKLLEGASTITLTA